MRRLLGEPHDFIFDRRTVTGARRLDLPAVHRRAMEIGPNQGMGVFIGFRQPAGDLWLSDGIRQKGKRLGQGVSRLLRAARKIDRASIQAARSARFEALQLESKIPE